MGFLLPGPLFFQHPRLFLLPEPVAVALDGDHRGVMQHSLQIILFQATKTAHEKDSLQRQIDATDRQIDRLVYELYDLTDDEIKIVEEAI